MEEKNEQDYSHIIQGKELINAIFASDDEFADFYDQIKLTPSGWTRLFDLFSRVVIGYGIYQLIAAFRRYGRK